MRVFVTADVSSKSGIIKLQQDIVSAARWSPGEVRPVDGQNLHFMLIFLGEEGGSMTGRIIAKLSEIQFQPFRITYTGIGGHPDPKNASRIWVGVDEEGAEKLKQLSEIIVSKMADIGLEPDKPFIPHVAIFHAMAGKLQIDRSFSKYNGKTFGSDFIDKIHLKKSDSTGSGLIHSKIFTQTSAGKID